MEGSELTWRQITDSRIFRDVARIAMWVSPILLSGALWLLADIRSNTVEAVEEIRVTVSAVVDTQADRAEDNERFQAATLKFQQAATLADEKQVTTLDSVKTDVATIKGILQAQQRSADARDLFPGWGNAADLTP
jgi:hypothetical protein